MMEPLMINDRRTILIAVDGSEGSDLAFEWAISNYSKPTDNIQLIHVRTQMDETVKWRLPAAAVSKMEAQADLSCRDILDHYLKQCAEKKLNCGWKVSVGDEREAICKEVLRVCADILIVGNRGVNAVKRCNPEPCSLTRMQTMRWSQMRALLGSVSDYCAHHCACPVIIVRARDLSKGGPGQFTVEERLLGKN